MEWDVIVYSSGNILQAIFSAIAKLFGNSSYIVAMKSTAVLAFMAALLKAAFDQNVFSNFRWFLSMVVFVMLVLAPKVSVNIIDRTEIVKNPVVRNVPIGLAAVTSFFTNTGDWLARNFDDTAAASNIEKYTHHGFAFPQQLLEMSRKVYFPDDRVLNNFMEFFASCVVLDGIGHHRFTWRDVMLSPNLVDFFEKNVAQHAAGFKYRSASITKSANKALIQSVNKESIKTCRSGFVSFLKPEMLALEDQISATAVGGGRILGFSSLSDAKNTLKNDITQLVKSIAGVTVTSKDFLVQQAMINAMVTSMQSLSQQIEASEFNRYLISAAQFDHLTMFQEFGTILMKRLSLIRLALEVMIYALFPLFVFVAIVLPARVSFAYAITMLWINLWTPMFAILHFVIFQFEKEAMSELVGLYGNGFSVFATAQLARLNADIAARAGYLGVILLILIWILLAKAGAMVMSFADNLMSSYSLSSGSGSKEVVQQQTRMGTKWERGGAGGIQNCNLM